MLDDLLIYNVDEIYDPVNLRAIIEYCLKNNIAYGNLWHNYLTHLILNDENYFSLACERNTPPKNSLTELAKRDIRYFLELYELEKPDEYNLNLNESDNANPICELAKKIVDAEKNLDAVFDLITNFYKTHGVGVFALNKAFRLGHKNNLEIVSGVGDMTLSDILGYKEQKRELIFNTEAFISGKPANNVLLYGDGGTGKSSSVKALLNDYFGRGLRIIEIYKHQFIKIPRLVNQLRNRNYYFIIFIDDLSFEENESDYKYLKAIIEGGIETRPSNILIYATSNRRHLVRELWRDREDMEHSGDVHRSDTLEEKLSLSSRFGVAINFSSPDRNLYHEIVIELAKKAGLEFNEQELLKRADAWEIRHGGKTGRAARQFIDYLLGQ